MNGPVTYPVWMFKDGQPDVLVLNPQGYTSALEQGYVYHNTTPETEVSPTVTIVEDAASQGQPEADPNGQ